jgi:hypothetical protein
MTAPWYTDQEIDDLCAGLHTNAAKVRHLRAQGLTVTQKPNGRPLVMRAHAEAVLAGLQQVQAVDVKADRPGPNRGALVALFGNRKAVA